MDDRRFIHQFGIYQFCLLPINYRTSPPPLDFEAYKVEKGEDAESKFAFANRAFSVLILY
jgi:hypothetical protein